MKTATRRTLIAVASVIFVLGLALSAKIFLMTWKAFGLIDKSFIRILVPGVRTVALPAPGTYTIFFEHQSELNGKNYSSSEDALDGLELSITSAETGESVDVHAAGVSGTYSWGSREGRALLSFHVDRAGWYQFTAALPDEDDEVRQFVLAIAKGFTKYIFLLIGMIFGLVVTVIITIVVPATIIVVAVSSRAAGTSSR